MGEGECSSSGSDSEPSEDNLELEELKVILPKHLAPKKKKGKKPKNPLPKVVKKPQVVVKKPLKKKCTRCGEEEGPTHQCKVEEPVKRKVVGVETYYNLHGKRVHDQQTQTPVEFYPKILQIRADHQAQLQATSRNFLSEIKQNHSEAPKELTSVNSEETLAPLAKAPL